MSVEHTHLFQDGNGRVGRLILFKECLKNNIVPFIIEDNLKLFYYRGLKEWDHEKGFLMDTCLTARIVLRPIGIILDCILNLFGDFLTDNSPRHSSLFTI